MRIPVLILFFFSYYSLFAQDLSNYRVKILAASDTILLDSLSIVPNSVMVLTVDSSPGAVNDFQVNYSEAKLFWIQGKKPGVDSVKISYRVFPLSFSKSYMHKDISKIEAGEKGALNPFSYTVEKQAEDILFMPGLNKQGSISRGISFGNNQDLSVNSTLNLQLSGRLTDNVNVLAAITDDNIPIQPEGNTQQLQEFDQVYIQLYNEQIRITAGDFQLRNNGSYFMKYFKKARGAGFNYATGTPEREGGVNSALLPDSLKAGRMRISGSGAISRGKFARNIVQGIEGNQGPYRLTGAERESFIIILSGTERVFIDGELLMRGQENDYIIDYNTAEITFTAKRLVTKDRRIIVEFQYSDKNYARSLFQFSDEFSTEKLTLRFHLFSEQDSKNQPLQQDLSEEQKILLSQVGDSLQEAVSHSIQNVGFSDSEVRYKIVDSLGYDSVFVYSTHPDSAVYRLGFSGVGQGEGNYVQVAGSANGRVFQWLAPDTINGLIVKKGSFEPLVLLIAPKKKQMGTIGGEYQVSGNTRLTFELAGSNNDINTFSVKDSKNDQGYAGKFNINSRVPIGSSNDTNWSVITTAGYEQVYKNFSFIEWFRSPEFDRDWNLRNNTLTSTQHIPEAGIGIERKSTGNIRYLFNSYFSEPVPGAVRNEFRGFKNNILSTVNTKGFTLNFDGSLMQSESMLNNTEFLRNKTSIARRFRHFTIGGRNDYEKNLFKDISGDTLLSNSYEFLEWEIFISNADTAKNKYMLSYDQRKDYAVKQNIPGGKNALGESTLGEFVSFSYDILKNENSKLRGKSTYRKLSISDTLLTAQKPDNTLLNRIEYSLRIFKGAFSFSSFYEIGSGLEVKKEFSYIEVPAGQGVYAWMDYNGNGIKELNEFEVSAFPDQARFIRVFTPTNEFVKTYTNQFNQTFFIQPAAVWNGKTGIRKFISKFSDQLAYRIDRKTTRENQETAYNPFIENIADTNLLSLNSSFRNTFYFNRTHPEFGFDINYQDSKNKTLLTNGFESRKNIFREISLRWNITNDFLLNLVSGNGIKTNASEFFSSRNYLIDYYKVQPKITFQPGTTYRISVFYEYLEKSNRIDFGGEKSLNRKTGAEVKVNSAGKGSLLANVSYIKIDFNGAANTSLSFEMLEGLLPGNNVTWAVSWQQTMANNLQLSLNYNGRSSEKSKVIHTGGVQVRAFF